MISTLISTEIQLYLGWIQPQMNELPHLHLDKCSWLREKLNTREKNGFPNKNGFPKKNMDILRENKMDFPRRRKIPEEEKKFPPPQKKKSEKNILTTLTILTT